MLFTTKREVILFHGDSVTDCGRDREDPAGLGAGYPERVAAWLPPLLPDTELSFVNRGVGGFRVRDLEANWDADCVKLRPTVVSVLIGINDTWRRVDANDPTEV